MYTTQGVVSELFPEGEEWLWISMIDCFLFLSNTFRVKRSPKKSPLSDTSQVCTSFFMYISFTWVYQFSLSEFLLHPSDFFTLCCRNLRLQMNPPPFIHRMTTPQTKRSLPPPPVISGRPCKTWMQIWILTNRTSLTHLILRPSLMRTVFLFRPQVRQNVVIWFLFPSLYRQPPAPKQCLQRSKHTTDRQCSKQIESICLDELLCTPISNFPLYWFLLWH